MEKVKVSKAVADAIAFVTKSFKNVDILAAHKRDPRGWILRENEALKQIDYGTLQKALIHGYEIEDESTTFHTSSRMDAFKGIEIRILQGNCKGQVLPITQITEDGELFELGGKILLMTSTRGKWWEFADERPQNKTPKPMWVPISPTTNQKPSKQALEAELDYELASLYDAMQQGDQVEVERSKKRLAEIHEELGLVPVLEGY
ncbi:hypothetical protein [Lysinibacillus sp. LZ02]|uniref:hypothetical protein n=1 Tax=Lysinibacillus sp. LZ02 TaxID=3420668 RepID=UPI003D37013C